MITALLVSNLVLWLVVVGLGVTVLALARQVGVLHERIAPAGALSLRGGPEVGQPAPIHELLALDGTLLRVGGTRDDGRTTLLVFVAPDCPVCRELAPALRALARRERRWLELVLASDGGETAEHAAYAKRIGLEEHPYVLSSALGLAYQVGKLPHAVLVDGAGILRAKGLCNSREHLESLLEAQARGVASIQEHLERQAAAAGGMGE